jgi:hypothetical protein
VKTPTTVRPRALFRPLARPPARCEIVKISALLSQLKNSFITLRFASCLPARPLVYPSEQVFENSRVKKGTSLALKKEKEVSMSHSAITVAVVVVGLWAIQL